MATPKQVDGKHHLLRKNFFAGGRVRWELLRKDDGRLVSYSEIEEPDDYMLGQMRVSDARAAHFIQKGREQAADALENAATDCDGHTPYSICMALAEELRKGGGDA